jgi:hypothetical protein
MRKIIILLFISSTLFAYVNMQSANGGPEVYWALHQVPIYYVPGESGTDSDPVEHAASAWLHPESYLTFKLMRISATYISAGDSFNSIKFAHEDQDSVDASVYFDDWDYMENGLPETLAYTLTTTADYSGRIVDADIVVGVHMIDNSGASGIGLDNMAEILVHEFGHFIGLDHTCEFGGDLYAGIKDCQPIENPMYEPIMYPKPLDPQRINMTDDDAAGLLSLYRYKVKKYKGCGFLGSVDTNSSSGGGRNAFLVILLMAPVLLIAVMRMKSLSLQCVRVKRD